MSDLTTFQVSLLKAVVEGHTKFSGAEVINRYQLNSSANVRRLKDALCKKEILIFDSDDEAPRFEDPLFEYWVTKFYSSILIPSVFSTIRATCSLLAAPLPHMACLALRGAYSNTRAS